MLRGMAPESWDEQGVGGLSIREATDALLANDVGHLKKIVTLLGSPAAS
jgi:hypothetical protein